MARPTCGNCRFQSDLKCYLRPPEIVQIKEKNIRNMRPHVLSDDPGCLEYQAEAQPQPPIRDRY